MPKSKSKRKKVLQAERATLQARQRSNQAFNRVAAESRAEARADGLVPITLSDVPAAMRPQIEATMRRIGSRAKLYRKPDGGIAAMA